MLQRNGNGICFERTIRHRNKNESVAFSESCTKKPAKEKRKQPTKSTNPYAHSTVLANVAAIPPPANALFVPAIAWQMLGYAAFFPAGGGAAQLYAAQKRQFVVGANIANNNPLVGGNLFNYSTNMHTERQLTIAVLEQQIAPIPIAIAAGAVIQGAMNVPAIAPAPVGIQALIGSLHVYVPQNPCQNATAENGNFSCINYYNNLANFVPNVHFDIYFIGVNMRLNRDFVRQTPGAVDALCNFIQANPVGHFQIAGGWLQYNNARAGWINLVQQNPLGGWNAAAAIGNGNVNILVREVNRQLENGVFNNPQIDQMLNNVHMLGGIANLVYHAI